MRRAVFIALTVLVCSVASWSQTLAAAEQHNQRGLAFFNASRFIEAEQDYKKGIAIIRNLGETKVPEYSALLINLGVALQSQGRITEARKLFEECVEVEKTRGNRGTALAHALNNLALMHLSEMEFSKAVSLLKRSLTLEYVEERTRVSTNHNLAAVYFEMGQRTKAEQLFQRTIDEYDRLGMTAELAPALTFLAKIAAGKGDEVGAETLLLRALDNRKKVYGASHVTVGLTLSDIGDFETERGRYEAAVAYFEQALALIEPTLGVDHVYSAPILYHFAVARQRQGRFEEALALYERTLAILVRSHGPEHTRLAQVYHNASECSAKLKRKPEAKEYELRARTIRDRTVEYGRHSIDLSSFTQRK